MRQSRILLLVLSVLLIANLAMAQTEVGQVTGTVLDPSGARVPKATVSLRSVATGLVRKVESNEAGLYLIPGVMPGNYELTAEAPGFSKYSQAVVVAVGARVGVDIRMEVGRAETVVQVTEAAGQVNVETQTLATVVGSRSIEELPTLTRNPYDLVATAGNVTEDGAYGRGAGYTINGLRSASTGILLDGAANNDEFSASVGMSVPLDSVQEFSVLTNNFTAEFGRAAGGVVNVATKSGTNEYHGTLYEFNRVSRLASNTPDNNANEIARPVFTRNQYGYSIGGPIKKDKVFFFQNTEWFKVRSKAPVIAYMPTSQLIAASAQPTRDFFGALGKEKAGLTKYETLTKSDLAARGVDICAGASAGGPCQLLPGSTPIFQRVGYFVPSDAGGGTPRDEYQLVGRVDYNMSATTQLYGRYAIQDGNYFEGTNADSPFAGYDTGSKIRNQSYLASLVHSISPTLFIQSKLVFNRFLNVQPLGDAPVSPTLYFNPTQRQTLLGNRVALPGYLPYNPGSAIPFGGPQNFVQLYQDVNWSSGRHQFRFGGSYNYIRDNRTFGAYMNPVMALNTSSGWGRSFDNLLNGRAQRFNGAIDPQGKYPCDSASNPTPACTVTLPVGMPDFSRSNRYHEIGFYVQDSYRVSSRLTVNLGLRWEYFGVQHNKDPKKDSNYYDGNGANVWEQIRNGDVMLAADSPVGGLWVKRWRNFAPRLGFAWDVFGNGKTSLRGGYGISYERNFGNVTFNVIQNPPNYAVVALDAGIDVPSITITANPSGPLSGSTGSKALPAVSLRNVDANIQQARAQVWSASLEHEVTKGLVAAVDYSASRGDNLYGIANYNTVGAGNVYLKDPCTAGDPFSCTARLKKTRYTSINRRDSIGSSQYHSMNFRIDAENVAGSGVTLRSNWTWGHAIDNLSSTFSESDNNYNLGFLDPFNPNLDRGDADFDNRHRWSISGIWDIPVAKNSQGVLKHLAAGWQIAPIITMRTGTPFSLYDSTNTWYWNVPRIMPKGQMPKSGNSSGPAEGTPNRIIYYDWTNVPLDQEWVNPITGTSEFGPFPGNMTGRNVFRGPGSWNIDLAVYKRFQINERVSAQLRGEMYNMPNHPNLYARTDEADAWSTSYMTAWRDGRRNVQLALKIIF